MTLDHRITASLVAAVVGLAACGSTPTKSGSGSETVVSPSPTAGVAAKVAVGKTFYYAGFKVTLGEARYTPTKKGSSGYVLERGKLDIDTEFENLGTDNASFFSERSVASSGMNYEPGGPDDVLPAVPGLAKGKGVFGFAIDGPFKFSDAVLTVGNAANNRAAVSLAPSASASDKLLEPSDQAVTGVLPAGDLQITVNGVTVRADEPDRHREVKSGHLALDVKFSVTRTGTDGGINFFGSNFALKLPDGTSVVDDENNRSPNEILKGGETKADLFLRFLVNSPAAGSYTLSYDDKHAHAGSLTFDVSSSTSGGSAPSPSPGTSNSEPSPGATAH